MALFWTGARYEGGKEAIIPAPLERIPLFVRDNSLVPLARPLAHCADDAVFDLDVRVYGDAPAPFVLWEDDGISFDYEKGAFNEVTLEWTNETGSVVRKGSYASHRYRILTWEESGTSTVQINP